MGWPRSDLVKVLQVLLDGPGQDDDDDADGDDGDIYMTHCELMRSKQSQSLTKVKVVSWY